MYNTSGFYKLVIVLIVCIHLMESIEIDATICALNNIGIPVFLPHADCTKYYICVDSVPVEHNCSNGLMWNQLIGACDFAENVDCPTYCPLDDDPSKPTLLAYPSDCTKFYMCDNGAPIEMNCPDGFHWYDEKHWCDYPELANCVPNSNPHPIIPSTTPSTPRPSTEPPTFICPEDDDPENPTLFPSTYNCSIFYKCYNNVPVPVACEYQLEFNPYTNECDYPNLDNCTPDGGPPVTDEPNLYTCPKYDDPMNPTLLPHETDCTKFYICANQKRMEFNCPPTLHWNMDALFCDDADLAHCIRPL